MKVRRKDDGKVFECHLFDGTGFGVEKVENTGENKRAEFPQVQFWYYLQLTAPSGEVVRQDVKPGNLLLQDPETGALTAMRPEMFGREFEEVASDS